MKCETTRKVITKVLEKIYLVILGVYLFYLMDRYTMLTMNFPSRFEYVLLYLAIGITLIRLVWNHRLGWDLLGAAALAGAFFASYGSTKYLFLAMLGVMIVGARDIPYRDILKVHFFVVGSTTIVMALMAMTGAVEALVYTNKGFMQLRGCAGMCYPTDAASLILYLILVIWCLWPHMPGVMMLAIAFTGYLLSAKYYVSDTSAICFIALMLAVLWRMLERHVIDKHSDMAWMMKVVNLLCAAAFPVMAAGMIGLVYLYGQGNELAVRINGWMSGRVDFAWRAVEKFGLSFWGTAFDMIGGGGSTYGNIDYFFVDSTYPLILVRYGIILLLVITVGWIFLTVCVCKHGYREMMFVFAIVALHSLSEYHYFDVNYNVFLLLPLAKLSKSKKVRKVNRKVLLGAGLTFCTTGLFLVLFLSKVITILRTVTEVQNLRNGEVSGIVLFYMYFSFLILLGVFGYGWYRVYVRLIKKGNVQLRNIAPLLASVAIGLFVYSFFYMSADEKTDEYMEKIASERTAIELALSSSQGGVFVDKIPTIYQKFFPNIRNTIFSRDELGRKYNATIITSRRDEAVALIDHAFLYIPVSEDCAIYTNDEAVVRAFEKNEYHVTGYYPEERYVDLGYAAKLSGLKLGENNVLNLCGGESELNKGPWTACYAGEYTSYVRMRTSEPLMEEDYLLCKIYVNGLPSDWTCGEKEVYRSQLDESGFAEIDIPYYLWNGSHSMEWQIIPAKNCSIQILDIRYRRTPRFDEHSFFDRGHGYCYQEFFDLDGQLVKLGNGFVVAERTFDKKGNELSARFFDEDGIEVLNE